MKKLIFSLLSFSIGMLGAQTGHHNGHGHGHGNGSGHGHGNGHPQGNPGGGTYHGGNPRSQSYGYSNSGVYASGTVVTRGNNSRGNNYYGAGQGQYNYGGPSYGNYAPGYGNCRPNFVVPGHACGQSCNRNYHISQTRFVINNQYNRNQSCRITQGLVWVPGYWSMGFGGCRSWLEGGWVWQEIGRENYWPGCGW